MSKSNNNMANIFNSILNPKSKSSTATERFEKIDSRLDEIEEVLSYIIATCKDCEDSDPEEDEENDGDIIVEILKTDSKVCADKRKSDNVLENINKKKKQ